MTFEEYKKLAENTQFSDAPAIFKVEVYVIDSCGSKKYYRKTMSEPWKYSEIYCLTLERKPSNVFTMKWIELDLKNIVLTFIRYQLTKVPIFLMIELGYMTITEI